MRLYLLLRSSRSIAHMYFGRPEHTLTLVIVRAASRGRKREGRVAVGMSLRRTCADGPQLYWIIRSSALVCAGAVGAGEVGAAATDNLHELVQHDEFEAQLDTVHRGFEDRLYAEQADVFGREECRIQEDDKQIDPDQVFEDLAGLLLLEDLAGSEDSPRFT